MRIKRIGLVLETKEDALKTDPAKLDQLYHWREPEELEALVKALTSLGFIVLPVGPPALLCQQLSQWHGQLDFIFNLSVGFRSKNRLALAPSLYELSGLPYSGAEPYTKMISQHKHLLKSFWDKLAIPTPAWAYLHSPADLDRVSFPEFPLIIKPASEGSSIGLNQGSVVYDQTNLVKQIHWLFHQLNMPIIVERFIVGREYKVAIIGNQEPDFIGLIEDVQANGEALGEEFLFFNVKLAGSRGKKARNIKAPEFGPLLADCLKSYRLFLPVDYGTFDIRVDDRGRHYFLEFNADATLHPHRTLAQCCDLNGLAYPEMIERILKTSFQRWGIPWN